MVGVVDDEIHSREADDFMQLVAPLVDGAVARHEDAHFFTAFLSGLGQVAADEAHLRFRQIRGDFLVDEKYSCHVVCSFGLGKQSYEKFPKRSEKIYK